MQSQELINNSNYEPPRFLSATDSKTLEGRLTGTVSGLGMHKPIVLKNKFLKNPVTE